VIISLVESGSLRLYGHRETVRWDVVAPGDLDQTIETLHANGYEPYILVEGSERPAFAARFGRTRYGGLDWPPMASYNDYEEVRLYSMSDRRDNRPRGQITTARIRP
jgi:hypothetical protein